MSKKSFVSIPWDWVVVIILMLVYAGVFSYYSILRHNAFASGYDLANADQTIWNTLHGHFLQLSSKGRLLSRLTIHADIIFALFAPLYLLWDNVRLILILQSVGLASGAIPVYLLSRKLLKQTTTSFFCVLMYLLNPSMQWTNTYDFHGVAFAIPLLLFTFYFAYTKNWHWYWLFAFFALWTKEEVSLLVAMIGAYLFFYRQQRKIGLITMAIGMSWFLAVVFVVMPYFRDGSQHWALAWYQFAEPETDAENSNTFMLKEVVHRLFLADDVGPYYFALVKPFAIIFPLIGFPEFILAAPELVINTLSTHAEMRGTMLHYTSGITPFLMIATIFGLHAVLSFIKKHRLFSPYSSWAPYFVLAASLAVVLRVNYHNTPLPYNPSCYCQIYAVTAQDEQFERILQAIPTGASMTSSPEIRPHITHRVESYTLPRRVKSADYIALIDQNRIVGDYADKSYELTLRDQLIGGTAYELIEHVGHFSLFRKRTPVGT